MTEPAASHRKRLRKVGLRLPDTEREMVGGIAHWTDLDAMAKRAGEIGFDSSWVADNPPWNAWGRNSAADPALNTLAGIEALAPMLERLDKA